MERLKIRFGLSFWIFLAMATVLRKGYFAIMYFAAVLLHELAHYFVADRLFYRCYEVRVSVFGAVLYGDFTDVYPRDRILIAVAGPAANFVAAVLCFVVGCAANIRAHGKLFCGKHYDGTCQLASVLSAGRRSRADGTA